MSQTYKNIEVLVINDGSTDGGLTRDIALSFGNCIRYIEKPNGGVSTALNFGITEMRGDYFSWLSHDDIYLPYHIESQVETLIKTPEADSVISGTRQFFFFENLVINRKDKFSIFSKVAAPISHYVYWFYACSIIVKKEFFAQHFQFNADYRTIQDIAYSLSVLRFTNVAFNENEYSLRREHDNPINQKEVQFINNKEYYILLTSIINKHGLRFFVSNPRGGVNPLLLIIFYADLISNKYDDLKEVFVNRIMQTYPSLMYFRMPLKAGLYAASKFYSLINRAYRSIRLSIYCSFSYTNKSKRFD